MCPRPLSEMKHGTHCKELEIPNSDHPNADQLIRLLAGLALKSGNVQPAQNHDSCEEILVDAELDGFRYLLVRLPKPSSSRVSLSPREQEIVRMVAQGHPNKVIAGVLNISGWTVCTHLRRIFAKLGVGSRAAMVARLLDLGRAEGHFRSAPVNHSTGQAQTTTGSGSERFEEKMAARAGRR